MHAVQHEAGLDLPVGADKALNVLLALLRRFAHDFPEHTRKRIGYRAKMIKPCCHSSPRSPGGLPFLQVQNDVRIRLVVVARLRDAVDMIAIHQPHIRANVRAATPAHVRPTADPWKVLSRLHLLVRTPGTKRDRHITESWYICPRPGVCETARC